MTPDIPLAIHIVCHRLRRHRLHQFEPAGLPPEVAPRPGLVGTVAAIQTVGGTVAGMHVELADRRRGPDQSRILTWRRYSRYRRAHCSARSTICSWSAGIGKDDGRTGTQPLTPVTLSPGTGNTAVITSSGRFLRQHVPGDNGMPLDRIRPAAPDLDRSFAEHRSPLLQHQDGTGKLAAGFPDRRGRDRDRCRRRHDSPPSWRMAHLGPAKCRVVGLDRLR